MVDQNDDFIGKESCESFCVFYKFEMDGTWSINCMLELIRKHSQTKFIQWTNCFHICLGHTYDFLIIISR